MQKRYIVRLTDGERNELRAVVKKLKRTGQKVRRAQILLRRMPMGRTGRIVNRRRVFDVVPRRSRTCDSTLSSAALERR